VSRSHVCVRTPKGPLASHRSLDKMRATRLLPGLLPGVRRLVGNAGAAADVGGVRRVSGSGPAEGWSAWSERASGWRGRVGRGTFAPSAAEISSAPAKETPKHFLVPLPVLSPLMVRHQRCRTKCAV
jgi:hypothetical protein